MFFKDDDEKKAAAAPPKTLPLLPLRDIIVFPYMVVPLFVGREKSIRALEEAMSKDKELFLAAQKRAKVNDPTEDDIYPVGTVGQIIHMLRLPDQTVKVLVEGKRRARVQRYLGKPEFFQVDVTELPEDRTVTPEIEGLMRTVKGTFETYVKIHKRLPPELLVSIQGLEDPVRLADTIVAHLNLKLPDKQLVLELESTQKRLEKLFELMQAEIEILQVEKKIRTRVKKQMEKSQKEYYLNEQMQAIQKELGERDEFKNEIQELEERIKNKKMSPEAEQKVRKEFKKLKMMSPMSAEATVVRNYIDWMLSLPWFDMTPDKLNIQEAEKILDEDHYGLRKVKDRILEYLAVQKLTDKIRGPILCLVGPPGVGKTSLAKSVARATGRKFVRLSLGGVRDEAEIRGHRRTYIGALPGKIIQSLKKATSNNPVFLLDEVDKMSMDFRGDPSAALLEVLDPEQNTTFNDHYLDVDYDLSNILFITTANTLHGIPIPLQDRMEIIRLAGYTEAEKLSIGRRYLVPRQIEANGLKATNLEVTDGALKKIVRRYTREAGVRNLEREISTIARKVAKKVVKDGPEITVKVGPQNVGKFLGVTRFRHSRAEQEDGIGMTTGLAWTEHGGDLLVTEVTVMPGKGKLIITGKLGDVMQESAQAAMSYVRSRAAALGLPKHFYSNVDLHIHVPEGAIPKDGPSAGITLATAITSALTKAPVRKDLAMTGEITLRGRVLPIGGLKEKTLAAHRGGVKTILYPMENKKDLREIPANILKRLTMIPVSHMDEVLVEALVMPNRDEFLAKLKARVEDPHPVWHDPREEAKHPAPAAPASESAEPAGPH